MQDRYAGDAGDFGKLGLLRSLAKSGLLVGVNWYLSADEAHNEDGRHTGYLRDSKFVGCDDELLGKLSCMVYGNQRSVQALQELNLIPSAGFYSRELMPPGEAHTGFRQEWHETALQALHDTDIVFLDPDNGLLPDSVSRGSAKSVKYVLQQEIIDYYLAGHSVVFYNHRWHMDEEHYLNRFRAFFDCKALHDAGTIGIKYVRGTIRDYFFLLQPRHIDRVEHAIRAMLSGSWSRHFKRLPIE